MKRSYFKRKPTKPLKRTKLRIKGHSSTTELKEELQSLLRQICLIRDGGCILRNYSKAGRCGGYRNDGGLILQAEHLVTRSNSSSFADTRNIVILCRNHHIFFKPQHSSLYWELVQDYVGEERWKWIQRVRDDYTPHKVDLKLELLALKQELNKLTATTDGAKI